MSEMLVNGSIIEYTQGELNINSPHVRVSTTHTGLINMRKVLPMKTGHKSTSIAVSRQPALLNPSDFPEVAPMDQPALRGFIRGNASPTDPIYVAIDVIMWAKDEDYETAKQSIQYYKRLVKDDGSQLLENLHRLKVMGQDGRMRVTDVVTRKQVLRLIQDIPGKKSNVLKDWLAELGDRELQAQQDAAFNALPSREKKYVREQLKHGVDQSSALATIPDRVEGIDVINLLKDEIKRKVADPRYWEVFNAEYMAIFDLRADEIRQLLHTKSIRDALPPTQMSIVKSSELMLLDVLKQASRMDMSDLLEAIDEIMTPMGKILRNASRLAGVHHVTGRPLLKAGDQ